MTQPAASDFSSRGKARTAKTTHLQGYHPVAGSFWTASAKAHGLGSSTAHLGLACRRVVPVISSDSIKGAETQHHCFKNNDSGRVRMGGPHGEGISVLLHNAGKKFLWSNLRGTTGTATRGKGAERVKNIVRSTSGKH